MYYTREEVRSFHDRRCVVVSKTTLGSHRSLEVFENMAMENIAMVTRVRNMDLIMLNNLAMIGLPEFFDV